VKGGCTLAVYVGSIREVDNKTSVLDEIIDYAVGISIEEQDILLMMAKAMRYTRDCVSSQYPVRTPVEYGERM
jgi:hypothetical protein